uniref:Uncharacterized protein n=1 Tax=Arundo donax TaxID=35708 RepID=A0A0A9GMT7_ARUDO
MARWSMQQSAVGVGTSVAIANLHCLTSYWVDKFNSDANIYNRYVL